MHHPKEEKKLLSPIQDVDAKMQNWGGNESPLIFSPTPHLLFYQIFDKKMKQDFKNVYKTPKINRLSTTRSGVLFYPFASVRAYLR